MDRDEMVASMVAAARRENERERLAAARRRIQALEEAERIARALASDIMGLRKIILFGSILDEERFRIVSDIDMAIEGRDILAAMEIAETSAFKIDLVDIPRLKPGFRSMLIASGKVLYEKG
jgi:predicted nucleotidyltransferase